MPRRYAIDYSEVLLWSKYKNQLKQKLQNMDFIEKKTWLLLRIKTVL